MKLVAPDPQRLIDLLAATGSCAVAFSGGVDSSVVARAAVEALGEQAVAVTGVSPSLSPRELETARAVARGIGIRHVELPTDEFSQPEYTRNAPDRCYYCKSELYLQIDRVQRELAVEVVVNGANADDLGDYRPGLKAAEEQGVRSPLAECGWGKEAVRQIAKQWDLPVWDKPASPCLSSRVAYGEEVTPQRLQQIDRAEQFLRDKGFPRVRVRYHRGDLARIETPLADLARLLEEPFRTQLVQTLKNVGFRFLTLDLEGFRSGSLNALVPLETLRDAQQARSGGSD